MIPAAGRDVQCSNCATTWFQPGVRSQAVDRAAETPQGRPPAPEPSPDADDPTPDAPASAPGDAPQQAADAAEDRPTARAIDPDVADILRQEAERETQLRRAEAEPEPVETQSEMSLEASVDRARSMRRAIIDESGPITDPISEPDAELQEEALAAAASAAAATTAEAPQSRRELLPDIEEINSTLRATGDRAPGEEDATDIDTIANAKKRRGQVRRGFFLVVMLAVLAWGAYTQAPRIAAAVPQATPILRSYVDAVDNARLWLDDFARNVASGSGGT